MSNQPINLEMFCSSDPSRPVLARPFSIGLWSYATNGHILVRVPRRDDVAENPEAPNAAHFYETAKKPRRYEPLPKLELAEPFEWEEQLECWRCLGKGKAHHFCPDCRCECRECSGTGKGTTKHFKTTQIGSGSYNSKYVSWLQSLPNTEIGQPYKRKPLAFRFRGGEGLLMPCRV
jgi:hypothetical protein